MKTKISWIIMFLITGYIISGCTPKAKYERMLKRELASKVRYDSLFMGFYFGMPEKEFYTRCWLLNGQGIIKQGVRNYTVEYQMKDELKFPGTMDFYPEFIDGKISEMPVEFIYNGWAPWNKKLSADSLQMDILKWYEKQYGGGFIEIQHKTRGSAYVKVNGNRRISIFKEGDMHVWAIFTDMLVYKESNDTISKVGKIQRDISRKLEN